MIDSDGHVILSGLEYAKLVEHSGKVQEVIETTPEAKEYHAPELLLGWAHDFAVDCWGYGLLLHFMLSSIVSQIILDFQKDRVIDDSSHFQNPLRLNGKDHISLHRKIIHDPIDLHATLEPLVRDLITKVITTNVSSVLDGLIIMWPRSV